MLRRRVLMVSAAYATFAGAAANGWAQVSKEILLERWESNWVAVADLEVTFELRNSGPATGGADGIIPFVVYTLRSNGIQYLSREVIPGRGIVNEASYDPSLHLGWRYNNSGRGHGWISARDQAYAGAPRWLSDLLRPPAWADYNPWGEHVRLSALLKSPTSHLRQALEQVDGRQAAVLDVYGEPQQASGQTLALSVWLDLERNAVPLRWVMYDQLSGLPRHTTLLGEYRSFDGTWLPMVISSTVGAGELAGTMSELRVQTNPDGPAVRLNAGLTPDECTVQFPPGTYVTNDQTEEWFIARGATTPEDAIREVYASGRDAATRETPPPRLHGALWLGTAALAGLLTGATLRLLRAK